MRTPELPAGRARESPADIAEALAEIAERMASLERRVEAIFVGQLDKEWYTTEEVAALAGRAPWTVREWCRHGRVQAVKRPGCDKWVLSRAELDRLLNEGLRPTPADAGVGRPGPAPVRKPR